MESNKKELMEFMIPCASKSLIEETLAIYNKIYKTDFLLIEYVLDEVHFARIQASNARLSDVFELGKTYARVLDKNKS